MLESRVSFEFRSCEGNAPNNGTPVHGIWTYGHWCGAGGSGNPTDPSDAACMAHDDCYAQAGFTPGSNFQGSNAQLQRPWHIDVISLLKMKPVVESPNNTTTNPSWALNPNPCTAAADAKFRAAVQQAGADQWADLRWNLGWASGFGLLADGAKGAVAPFTDLALAGSLAGMSRGSSKIFSQIQQQHEDDLALCQAPLVPSH